MPEPTTSPPADILARPKEERMMLAIEAIANASYKANGNHVLSSRQATGMYHVARSTLDDRMKGIRTCAEAHVLQQSLSPAEEEVLVKWAKVMGRRGVPLTSSMVAKYTSEISGKSIGVLWPKRFLARHPDLKIKATTSLEKCHAKALNTTAVEGFYDILEKVVEEFSIKPENTWNMDEKGVQLGIGAKIAAIIDREQSSVYSVEDGNRELVTIIEAVSATGAALIPSIIFQGVRRNPEWGRPENNPSSARYVVISLSQLFTPVNNDLYSVSVSPKGWTDQELGLKWLERDFELNTRPQNPQEFRLLILDGHNSHCTYPFIKFSAEHRILIICLPSHTTHALQPCDVGVFGPLTHAWKSQVTQASQDNVPITKYNLLRYYHNAQSIALKPSTIQSTFRKTGIYPLNCNAIPESAFEPAKNTTTEAAQPLPAQLPPSLVPTPNPSPAVSAAVPAEVPTDDYVPNPNSRTSSAAGSGLRQ